MKTSARNQLSGTIKAIHTGAVNAEVEIALVGGESLVAQITLPSVNALALEAGSHVVALIKSSWIILATGEAEPRVSSRNRLRGTIVSVTPGAVNSEVELKLAGGAKVVATVTNESVAALGIAAGGTAWALFKASSVILAA